MGMCAKDSICETGITEIRLMDAVIIFIDSSNSRMKVLHDMDLIQVKTR